MAHRALWVGILAFVLAGCGPAPEFDRALHSTDSERIEDLRTLMTRHGIPFRDTERGGLSWRSKDEAQVNTLRAKLDKSTSVRYTNPEARKHLAKLLDDAKEDYILKERADGTWIMWFPKSEAEADELQMKVARYLSETYRDKLSGDCAPNQVAPSNSTLETDARQKQPRAAQCGR